MISFVNPEEYRCIEKDSFIKELKKRTTLDFIKYGGEVKWYISAA